MKHKMLSSILYTCTVDTHMEIYYISYTCISYVLDVYRPMCEQAGKGNKKQQGKRKEKPLLKCQGCVCICFFV